MAVAVGAFSVPIPPIGCDHDGRRFDRQIASLAARKRRGGAAGGARAEFSAFSGRGSEGRAASRRTPPPAARPLTDFPPAGSRGCGDADPPQPNGDQLT